MVISASNSVGAERSIDKKHFSLNTARILPEIRLSSAKRAHHLEIQSIHKTYIHQKSILSTSLTRCRADVVKGPDISEDLIKELSSEASLPRLPLPILTTQAADIVSIIRFPIGILNEGTLVRILSRPTISELARPGVFGAEVLVQVRR